MCCKIKVEFDLSKPNNARLAIGNGIAHMFAKKAEIEASPKPGKTRLDINSQKERLDTTLQHRSPDKSLYRLKNHYSPAHHQRFRHCRHDDKEGCCAGLAVSQCNSFEKGGEYPDPDDQAHFRGKEGN